ncbi:MAG: hypothetical protein ACYCXG_10495 [Acidiferrobacter sp.]
MKGLIDAAIVLPLLGEGFAGWVVVPLSGMLYFAMAHAVFFVFLGIAYDYLRNRYKIRNPGDRLVRKPT